MRLDAPAGWAATPAEQKFDLAKVGDTNRFTFSVTAPAEAAKVKIGVSAEVDGKRYQNDREVISYSHIPLQLLQPLAKVKAVSLDLATRGQDHWLSARRG